MTYYTIFSAISMPKPPKIRQFLLQLKSQLAKLSFRTGLWVLAGCAVSYLLAFVPLLFPLLEGTERSVSLKICENHR